MRKRSQGGSAARPLDELDRRILQVLERDAETDPRQIAIMLDLSADDVEARIANAQVGGAIVRRKVVVNWERTGEPFVLALIEVKVTPQRETGFDAIAERIYRYPEARSVYLVSGTYDLAVHVIGRTMQDVATFVAEKLAPLDGVQSTVTHFMLRRYKEDGDILVGHETVEAAGGHAVSETAARARLSRRVADLPPSGIRRFFDLITTLEGVVSLGVGEPDFTTPWHIREAAIHSLEHGYTMYTSNLGLPELRRAIARHLAERYEVRYDPDGEILVTVGVSEGLDLALRALLDPGDEVLIPEPSYVSYGPCTLLAGGVPVYVPASRESDFEVSVDEIARRVTPRTRAILVGYPNNPTGAVMPRGELERLARLAAERDLVVVSDEIYDRLVYGVEHTCFAALPGARDRTVLLGGFSKSYAMTGWRIGYLAAPADLIAGMVKIHQYAALCAPIMSQKAAVEALARGEADVQSMVREYDERRRLLVHGLNALGLDTFEPRGAFYAFPSIRATGLSEQFAERLLLEQRVAVVPGSAFGPSGEGHVRCCYATSTAGIVEALDRIGRFLESL